MYWRSCCPLPQKQVPSPREHGTSVRGKTHCTPVTFATGCRCVAAAGSLGVTALLSQMCEKKDIVRQRPAQRKTSWLFSYVGRWCRSQCNVVANGRLYVPCIWTFSTSLISLTLAYTSTKATLNNGTWSSTSHHCTRTSNSIDRRFQLLTHLQANQSNRNFREWRDPSDWNSVTRLRIGSLRVGASLVNECVFAVLALPPIPQSIEYRVVDQVQQVIKIRLRAM
jgi:hypothetical protein